MSWSWRVGIGVAGIVFLTSLYAAIRRLYTTYLDKIYAELGILKTEVEIREAVRNAIEFAINTPAIIAGITAVVLIMGILYKLGLIKKEV